MKFEPHPYQLYCINRLITEPAIGLFIDMGLGKTVITLTAVNDLKYNRFAVSRVLVIAPKKVAEATWNKEAAKWDHLKHLRIVPVLGSQTKRIRALNTPGDVWIINRENIPWIVDYYRNSWPFDMVVVDESTSFKNHQSKRFKALTWIRPHVKRIVELTGTPAPNGLLDLWAQMFLLDEGERLEKKITHYREKYFVSNYNGFGYEPKIGSDETIQQKISDICVSMKAEDYLQLPDMIIDDIPVALDEKAEKEYKRMEREALLEIDEQMVTATTAAALSNKLQQLCNGAVYTADRSVIEIHNCKIEALLELIEALNGQPAILFYNFVHDKDRIKAALNKSKLIVRELDGPQAENDWNDKKIDILLAHPASAAYGLNLQDGGNHVIWFGLTWNLELYQQANKRLHRQGQKQKVIVHRLSVIGGRDEDMIEALEEKGQTQDKLIESLKARIEEVKKGA